MKRIALIIALCLLTSWASASQFEDIKAEAEAGHVIYQSILARMYKRGQEVRRNNAEAIKWYRKSAEQGYLVAQIELAYMYESGEGVPPNYIEAYAWWAIATAESHPDSPHILERDRVASRLSPEDLVAAQKRAAKLFEEVQPLSDQDQAKLWHEIQSRKE